MTAGRVSRRSDVSMTKVARITQVGTEAYVHSEESPSRVCVFMCEVHLRENDLGGSKAGEETQRVKKRSSI